MATLGAAFDYASGVPDTGDQRFIYLQVSDKQK
jgi:hypothetical protein